MPDLADVEDEFVRLVVNALYPNGTDEPSVLGLLCRVYRGWPSSGTLNLDLQNELVNITVSPDTDLGFTTTRYTLEWDTPRTSPTLEASVDHNTVTLMGTASSDYVCGVLIDNASYIYRVRTGDTPAIIAANLAAMVRSTRPAHLTGTQFTVPNALRVVARVTAIGSRSREVRRQTRDIRVITWCPTPESRDQAASAIDHALARLSFLSLADDMKARILYKGTAVYDQAQNSKLYRRDLIYAVEYPTVLSEQLPAMLFGDLVLNSRRTTA